MAAVLLGLGCSEESKTAEREVAAQWSKRNEQMSNWNELNRSNKPKSSTNAVKSESLDSPVTCWDCSTSSATLESNDSILDTVVALYCACDVEAVVTKASLIGWQPGRLRRWQSNDVMFSGWVGRLGTGSRRSAGGMRPAGVEGVPPSMMTVLWLGGPAGSCFPSRSTHAAILVRCCITVFPCTECRHCYSDVCNRNSRVKTSLIYGTNRVGKMMATQVHLYASFIDKDT